MVQSKSDVLDRCAMAAQKAPACIIALIHHLPANLFPFSSVLPSCMIDLERLRENLLLALMYGIKIEYKTMNVRLRSEVQFLRCFQDGCLDAAGYIFSYCCYFSLPLCCLFPEFLVV